MKRMIFFTTIALLSAILVVLAVILLKNKADENGGTSTKKTNERQASEEAPRNNVTEIAGGQSRIAQNVADNSKQNDAGAGAENTQETPVPAVEAGVQQVSVEAQAIVNELKDTTVSTTDRSLRIKELAEKGDGASVEALMALGLEDTYLNFAAVEALGRVTNPTMRSRIIEYMRGRMGAQDLKVISAAITNYGRMLGEEAIPELTNVIRRNRVRGDGFELMVLTAAVEALQHIGSPRAVPILVEELRRSEEKGWSLAYGSSVVEALKQMSTPEGKVALTAYADRLGARRPEDPLAGPHYDEKIAEAHRAAGM